MTILTNFDSFEKNFSAKNITKLKSFKIESREFNLRSVSNKGNTQNEAQGSASREMKSGHINSLSRKVDYHIEQGSNELVIKIRNRETGEIIRQIPQEEFLRLTNRPSEERVSMASVASIPPRLINRRCNSIL